MDLIKRLVFRQLRFTEDGRTIAQKKIYILQRYGWDMGYFFKWEHKGPRSSELTKDIVDYLDTEWLNAFITPDSEYMLDARARSVIGKVNKLCHKFTELPEYGFTEKSWCVLITAIMYLFDNKKNWGLNNEDELFETIIHYLPKYSREQYDIAIKEINKAFGDEI